MHLSKISLYVCVYKFGSLCELHCSTLPLWIVVVLLNLAHTLNLPGYVRKYAIMKANNRQMARLVSETWRRARWALRWLRPENRLKCSTRPRFLRDSSVWSRWNTWAVYGTCRKKAIKAACLSVLNDVQWILLRFGRTACLSESTGKLRFKPNFDWFCNFFSLWERKNPA